MHRDIKIGLILGLVLVIIVMLRIATDPRLSPGARIRQLHETAAPEENTNFPNDMFLPAFEQEDLSYGKPAENIITQHEPEMDIPAATEPAIKSNSDSDSSIISIEKNQDEPVIEVFDSSKYEQTEKIQTRKFHIVQKNETLSGISQKYYGSANKWKNIYDFNRNVIEDPNKIRTGIKLIIPNL